MGFAGHSHGVARGYPETRHGKHALQFAPDVEGTRGRAVVEDGRQQRASAVRQLREVAHVVAPYAVPPGLLRHCPRPGATGVARIEAVRADPAAARLQNRRAVTAVFAIVAPEGAARDVEVRTLIVVAA